MQSQSAAIKGMSRWIELGQMGMSEKQLHKNNHSSIKAYKSSIKYARQKFAPIATGHGRFFEDGAERRGDYDVDISTTGLHSTSIEEQAYGRWSSPWL
jgi:hypothetical protein